MHTHKNLRRLAPALGTLVLALNLAGCDSGLDESLVSPDDGADAGHPPADAEPLDENRPLILADALANPHGLVLADDFAYVLVHPNVPEGAGKLLQIDRADGSVHRLASTMRSDGLVGAAGFLYWIEIDDATVRRYDTQTGHVATLGGGGAAVPRHLAVGDAGVVWSSGGLDVVRADRASTGALLARFDSEITGIVVNHDDVAVSLASGELWQVQVEGGARTRLLGGQNLAAGFAADAKHYYWLDGPRRVLMRVHKELLQLERLSLVDPDAGELVVSDDAIVWIESARSRVMRVDKRDGAFAIAAPVALDQTVPTSLVAAGGWLAWIDAAEGRVLLRAE